VAFGSAGPGEAETGAVARRRGEAVGVDPVGQARRLAGDPPASIPYGAEPA